MSELTLRERFKVKPMRERPHPSDCAIYDPSGECDCWFVRAQGEIRDLRAALHDALALLEQEPRTFDGQTMAQWADTLDAARDDMMMVEDYEPSDVAHVMTICANLLRGAHHDSEAGGEG